MCFKVHGGNLVLIAFSNNSEVKTIRPGSILNPLVVFSLKKIYDFIKQLVEVNNQTWPSKSTEIYQLS